MAEIEIELQDSISRPIDEIYTKLLNVTIVEQSDNVSTMEDNHSLFVLPAPIVEENDSVSRPTDNDTADIILISIPNIELNDSLSRFQDDINDDKIIDVNLVSYSENSTTLVEDNIGEVSIIGSPPEIISIIPSGGIYSQYPYFEVKAKSVCDVCYIDFRVEDNEGNEVFKVFQEEMQEIGEENGLKIYQFALKFDKYNQDFLLFNDYICNVKVYDDFGEDTETSNFSIVEDETYFEITEIKREYENNRLIITIKLRNRNETWLSIHNLFTNGLQNKNFKIVDVEGEEIYLLNERSVIIHSKGDYTEYKLVCEYETNTEFTDISAKLNQKLLKVKLQCLVYDLNGEEYDLTEFLKDISYNYSTELSSRQATISFVYNQLLCPYTNQDTPLFYGNKVVIKTYLSNDTEQYEFTEYIGYIKTVDTDNDVISIIALDKLSKFSQKLNEDLHFSPRKITVTENLRTLDGIKFKSSHSGWAQLPQPKIYVNGQLKKKGEYVIDYYRGEVYLSSNPYLDPEWIDQIVDMNDIPDRKTIDLYGQVNLSSDLKVKWTYMEKEDYSCVNGVDAEQVWIEKSIILIYGVDYTVDFENNKVILTNPIPTDTDTMKNHYITISYRKDVEPVRATYTYYEPGTNEVEQITKELALKLGFQEEDMQDIYEEEVVTKDGFNFYTRYKNIEEVLEFKVDNENYSDYTIIGGSIQTNKSFPSAEIVIDPFISYYFITASDETILSQDFEDKIFEGCSVVAEFNGTERWLTKKYGSTNVNLDLSAHREIAIMLKPDKEVLANVMFLTGEGVLVAGKEQILTANEWNKVIVNMENADINARRNIGFIKIFVDDNCKLKMQCLHVPSHKVQIKYKYNTLQPTGISINEVWFNKSETNSYMDVLAELYKQVDPSYVLYIDNKEKLRGEYKKLYPYYILPILHLYNKIVSENAYGGMIIPDYSTPLLSGFKHSISEEQLFSAVMVIGKLSQRNNVALVGGAEDVCNVVEGIPYIRTTYYTPKTGKYSYDSVLAEMLEEQGSEPVVITGRDAKTVIDSNSESGMYWYVRKDNDASRPFSAEEHMLTITLPYPIKWEEINVLIGIYKNYVIREELFIEVETEDGERFYPEEDYPTKKQGQSGTYLRWQNKRFKNKKIKKVYIYCSEAARWVTSKQVVGGGKK